MHTWLLTSKVYECRKFGLRYLTMRPLERVEKVGELYMSSAFLAV